MEQISIFASQSSLKSCPDGGIGRRAGLKNQWDFSLAGSIPAPGTKGPVSSNIYRVFFWHKVASWVTLNIP